MFWNGMFAQQIFLYLILGGFFWNCHRCLNGCSAAAGCFTVTVGHLKEQQRSPPPISPHCCGDASNLPGSVAAGCIYSTSISLRIIDYPGKCWEIRCYTIQWFLRCSTETRRHSSLPHLAPFLPGLEFYKIWAFWDLRQLLFHKWWRRRLFVLHLCVMETAFPPSPQVGREW